MTLIEKQLRQLRNDYWGADLIQPETRQKTSKYLIVGSLQPTTGLSFRMIPPQNLVKINCEDPKRILIVSKSGAGKSTLMSSLLFFGKLGGFQPFIPFDMKILPNGESEFSEMLRNLSLHYLGHNIFEGEIMSFMPFFLTGISKPQGKEVFQFDFGDLSESEIGILFNISKVGDFRKRDLIFNIISKLPRDNRTIEKLKEIFNDRIRLESFIGRGKDQTISSIMSNVATADRYGSIGSKYRVNFESLLKNGKILDICFPRYDSVHESMTQAYVAVMEKIMKNSLEKKRRSVLTAIDEGRIIIPRSKGEGESSRGEIIKNIKTTRYLGENMMFGVQDLKDVEESVASQAGVYFISHRVQKRDVERMLESTTLPDDIKDRVIHDKLPQIHLLSRKFPYCRPWLMISEEEKTQIVFPFLGK